MAALTVFQLWRQMLAHLTDFGATPPAEVLEAGWSTIRQGLAEVRNTAPWLFRFPSGVVFGPGDTYSLDLTAGLTAIPGSFPVSSGSTVYLPGDTGHNAIYQFGSAWHLLYPWQGATSTVTARIAADCVTLPAGTGRILSAVLADLNLPLDTVGSYADFTALQGFGAGTDYGSGLSSRQPITGTPRGLWLENVQNPGSPAQKLLHLAPLPYAITRVRLELLPATQLEIAGADQTALDAETDIPFNLPGEMDTTALRPIVMQLWSGCAWFSNEKARPEIGRQYTAALDALRKSRPMSTLRPSIRRSGY